MTATVIVAGYTALLGLTLRPLAPAPRSLARWVRSRWLLVAWDVPLTRGWEPVCWPGAWSPSARRWVRL